MPRIFHFTDRGRTYLFDCPFDDAEDFPDEYHVYLMPPLTAADTDASWADLYRRAVAELGRLPVTAVSFDPTKRLFFDASALDRFAAVPARAGG